MAVTMWNRWKPFLRRWLGLIINGTGVLFFALVAGLEYAGTNVDWGDIVGVEKAKYIVPGILLLNVVLRAVVTRTRGSPEQAGV